MQSRPGYDRVLRLEYDVPVAVDEERAERVVAVLTGVSRQLDRPRQMTQLLIRHTAQCLSSSAGPVLSESEARSRHPSRR